MTHFERLPLGAIKPLGWIKAQLLRDLDHGFAGRLDQLSPHAARDLFTDRIASSEQQIAWWDAETRGNWLWGYVLMAHVADHPAHIRRARELLADLTRTFAPGDVLTEVAHAEFKYGWYNMTGWLRKNLVTRANLEPAKTERHYTMVIFATVYRVNQP
jgi:hypothetical protein